jgi:L-lactate utilization protein LutC
MLTSSVNTSFNTLASDERLAKVSQALQANNLAVVVCETGEQARHYVLDRLPEGATIFTANSRTVEAIGLAAAIEQSSRFQAVRPRLLELRRQNQVRAMRQLGASPDVVIGSVHAVAEQGQVLIASGTGSQLASYVYGAPSVIWIVGTQKLVSDLDEGLRRIREYCYPLEDARTRETLGQGTIIGKILIVEREITPGRITMVLVKDHLGF